MLVQGMLSRLLALERRKAEPLFVKWDVRLCPRFFFFYIICKYDPHTPPFGVFFFCAVSAGSVAVAIEGRGNGIINSCYNLAIDYNLHLDS